MNSLSKLWITRSFAQYRRHLSGFSCILMSCILIQVTQGQHWATLTSDSLTTHEYWRLITAHFIHLNWQHFAFNMVGAGLCLLIFAKDVEISHWLISAIVISLFSSLGLIFTGFEGSYMGFSDTLYGWIVIGILSIYSKERWLSLLMLTFLTGRILYEQFFPSPFGELFDGATVASNSHLFGLLGGFLYFAFMILLKNRKNTG